MLIVILEDGQLVKDNLGNIIEVGNDVVFKEVSNLKEASKAVSEYIDYYGLGSSCFTGGSVYKDGKEYVRVSYNGRLWTLDDEPIHL